VKTIDGVEITVGMKLYHKDGRCHTVFNVWPARVIRGARPTDYITVETGRSFRKGRRVYPAPTSLEYPSNYYSSRDAIPYERRSNFTTGMGGGTT
jgi:hypothetical protein